MLPSRWNRHTLVSVFHLDAHLSVKCTRLSVRDIHKYPLFILGIYTNYSILFLLSSYLRLLFLVNSVLCLEWYFWNVTILLHKLVKGNLVKRATEHQTPAEFQYTSTLGSALLKHLQVATITLRPRPRPSGIQKEFPTSPDDSQEFPWSRRNAREASRVKRVTPSPSVAFSTIL